MSTFKQRVREALESWKKLGGLEGQRSPSVLAADIERLLAEDEMEDAAREAAAWKGFAAQVAPESSEAEKAEFVSGMLDSEKQRVAALADEMARLHAEGLALSKLHAALVKLREGAELSQEQKDMLRRHLNCATDFLRALEK